MIWGEALRTTSIRSLPGTKSMPAMAGDAIYNGVWALFAVFMALTAVFILIQADQIFYIVENFQVDNYDTILSVKWAGEYGIFGNIPHFPGPYSLFGNFPVLFALLGSLLNSVLGDPSLSVTVLYWLIDLSIAFLLWTRFLKNCGPGVKAAFIALFVVDVLFGNIFPFGYRKRQQLAILVGLLMFLAKSLPLELLLAFAALLAQPFTGALLIAMKAAQKLEGRDTAAIAALAIPFVLAYPFYSGLFQFGSAAPDYSGCSYITQMSYPSPELLFLAALAVFFLANRKKYGPVEMLSSAIALFYPVLLIAFLALKDVAPAALTGAFLQATSIPCAENFFNVVGVGLVLSVYLKKAAVPKATILLFLVISMHSILIASFALFGMVSAPSFCADLFHGIEASNITTVKSMEVLIMDYGGGIRFKPVMTLFAWQSYALLNQKNITFLDEYSMPPQLSKGRTNIPMAELPRAIYEGDAEACQGDVGQMRSAGVQAVVYALDRDITLKPGFSDRAFTDRERLGRCGITLLSSYSTATTTAVVYKIQ